MPDTPTPKVRRPFGAAHVVALIAVLAAVVGLAYLDQPYLAAALIFFAALTASSL